jgi:hypothetical protein
MAGFLRIEGDPTTWSVTTVIGPRELASGTPVALGVDEPLAGTLLLSPRAAGSTVLLPSAFGGHGHVPNGAILPKDQACIYVPSTTGPDPLCNPQRHYLLALSMNPAALLAEITAAMGAGTFVIVALAEEGRIVLNGATLPFVVLTPPIPRA